MTSRVDLTTDSLETTAGVTPTRSSESTPEGLPLKPNAISGVLAPPRTMVVTVRETREETGMRYASHRLVGLSAVVLPWLTAGFLASSAIAGSVHGTPRSETLRGTANPDKLYGNGGNDKLYGLAGNDYLNGGPGNDLLVGGPGADAIVCGPGVDVDVADATDKVAADCETVHGLPQPALSVADVLQAEGNAGSQPMSFIVTLAKASPLRVTVAYATTDGTATAGSDYTATSGQLVFAPGETSKTVAVPIIGDTAMEPDETLSLGLSSPVNAQLGDATATGTITNDDQATAKPGHYHGPISSGGFVDFDVSADGNNITNLTLIYFVTCQPSGSGTDTAHFGGDPIPIQPDGSFVADGSGTGITVSFRGAFKNVDLGLAFGTLQIHESLDDQGTHYECDTGSSNWAAAWRG